MKSRAYSYATKMRVKYPEQLNSNILSQCSQLLKEKDTITVLSHRNLSLNGQMGILGKELHHFCEDRPWGIQA